MTVLEQLLRNQEDNADAYGDAARIAEFRARAAR